MLAALHRRRNYVPPQSAGGGSLFANLPANYTRVVGDWNNGSGLGPGTGGFQEDQNPSAWGGKTRVSVGPSGVSAYGGPNYIQTLYAGGVDGGHDAGRMQCSLPANVTELYFLAELQFKADYPTSTASGGNKQLFVTFPGNLRYFVNMDTGLAAGRWGIYKQSAPLADAQSSIAVTYGTYNVLEWLLNQSTQRIRLWVNGVAAVDVVDTAFHAGNMVLAYDDGSCNGNHLVEGDTRTIRYEHGATVDAYRWATRLFAATLAA